MNAQSERFLSGKISLDVLLSCIRVLWKECSFVFFPLFHDGCSLANWR